MEVTPLPKDREAFCDLFGRMAARLFLDLERQGGSEAVAKLGEQTANTQPDE